MEVRFRPRHDLNVNTRNKCPDYILQPSGSGTVNSEEQEELLNCVVLVRDMLAKSKGKAPRDLDQEIIEAARMIREKRLPPIEFALWGWPAATQTMLRDNLRAAGVLDVLPNNPTRGKQILMKIVPALLNRELARYQNQ